MIKNGARALGICLGASTISAVVLRKTETGIVIEKTMLKAHDGDPKSVFAQVASRLEGMSLPVVVTGRKIREAVRAVSITEPEAVELGLGQLSGREGAQRFDAVVSAGGETFMVYMLDHQNRIAGISTGNKCASGTGEFFLQQIRRMGLCLDEAVILARRGIPYPVSGRCSVFCKSDCTHALNKGEPAANVTAGLCRMIARKIKEILARTRHERILLIGGTALNSGVTDFLKKDIPGLVIPAEAPYFEAYGAALAAFGSGKSLSADLFRPERSQFSYLPPLRSFEHLVTFNSLKTRAMREGEECLLGLDVGSTTTKAVLLGRSDFGLLASVYLRTNGNPIEASRACFKVLLEAQGGKDLKIIGLGVTGSGRHIAALYAQSPAVINEIIAHAEAAAYFDPEVDTIFEIGGQDAKYTHLTAGVASDYAMNEACSAGTGSFLEEAANESLGIAMEDIAEHALRGTNPPNFNDQCAAFISSDIKNAAHEGLTRDDILAGLVYSVAMNYNNRVKGSRPVGRKIFMQGGVCHNRAVPLAMAGILGKPIIVPPEPGLMGGFGVALATARRIERALLEPGSFSLETLVKRTVIYKAPFICAGGREKCDLKCSILRLDIDGTTFFFGWACNRYYGLKEQVVPNQERYDFIEARNRLMFPPEETGETLKGPLIGLNKSFQTLRLYPMYRAFFKELGCPVIMPERTSSSGVNRMVTSMCYPAELPISLFEDLMQKNPDFVFMPYVKEMYVPKGINRRDFCSVCAFAAGEAFWLRQAYLDKPEWQKKILSPYVNFNGGWEKGRPGFLDAGRALGFETRKTEKAFEAAVAAQKTFDEKYQALGRKALAELEADPDALGLVVFGRAYNAFAPEANKGIPKKFTSRAFRIIPYDCLPYADQALDEEYADYMHWAAGQKIFRTARLIQKHPQLFGVYISNFLCAPDSFLVSYFRRIMGPKPSLTLELDAHTADAGITTRIEAFLDIINNYRALPSQNKSGLRQKAGIQAFRPSKISVERMGAFFIDSAGGRFRLTDPAVRFIIPPMGDFGSNASAAVCRRLGIKAEALPRGDAEVLRLCRGGSTCKECIPLTIILGAMLKYLNNRPSERSGEKLMYLVPKAAGYCRLGQYHVYINNYIKEHRLEDLAILNLGMEEQYAGLGAAFGYNIWKALITTDILDDIECSLLALAEDVEKAHGIFKEECAKIIACL